MELFWACAIREHASFWAFSRCRGCFRAIRLDNHFFPVPGQHPVVAPDAGSSSLTFLLAAPQCSANARIASLRLGSRSSPPQKSLNLGLVLELEREKPSMVSRKGRRNLLQFVLLARNPLDSLCKAYASFRQLSLETRTPKRRSSLSRTQHGPGQI